MSTILDRILDTKRDEVATLRAPRNAMADLRSRCDDMPPTRGFAQTLAQAAGTAPRATTSTATRPIPLRMRRSLPAPPTRVGDGTAIRTVREGE